MDYNLEEGIQMMRDTLQLQNIITVYFMVNTPTPSKDPTPPN